MARRRRYRRNPSTNTWLILGGVGVAGVLAYLYFSKKTTTPAAPSSPVVGGGAPVVKTVYVTTPGKPEVRTVYVQATPSLAQLRAAQNMFGQQVTTAATQAPDSTPVTLPPAQQMTASIQSLVRAPQIATGPFNVPLDPNVSASASFRF